MLEGLDENVGRVMRALDRLDLARRTVVFLTSDDGGVADVRTYTPDPLPPTSNLPLRSGKARLYEGGIRIPLIVRWPGVVRPNTVCATSVITNDFFATIAEMARVRPNTGTDGVSLAPLLTGAGGIARDAIYWHYLHYPGLGIMPMSGVRSVGYKRIEVIDDGRVELYNLDAEIGERADLAAAQPARAASLRSMLHRWQTAVGAQKMTPNPAYRRQCPGGIRCANDPRFRGCDPPNRR